MTEKDAVKCKSYAPKECWFLPVTAEFNGPFIQTIIEKLKIIMDKKLLDILVCPICKSELDLQSGDSELACKPCKLAFPIKDGIPIMLEEEARHIPTD